MKIVTPYMHAVDDHMETIFNMIECECDIETEFAVEQVSQIKYP